MLKINRKRYHPGLDPGVYEKIIFNKRVETYVLKCAKSHSATIFFSAYLLLRMNYTLRFSIFYYIFHFLLSYYTRFIAM